MVTGADGRTQRTIEIDDRTDLEGLRAKPHRADGFKLSNDPLFVEVYDIVGLYLNSHPSPLSCSASMRSPRSKRCLGPSRRFR